MDPGLQVLQERQRSRSETRPEESSFKRQGSTRRSVKEFAKAFNNDTQVPPAIRQAQKEAERQKQILAVLEREQKQFEEMQNSSEAFRRKVREEQAKKENLEKQRAAMLA